MNGHVPQYLDTEGQRLRAERAEGQARRWRVTAYILLALLVVQTWLVVDTATVLADQRSDNVDLRNQVQDLLVERDALKSFWRTALEARTDAERTWELLARELQDELVVYSGQALDESRARDVAEEKFRVCLAANAGLVQTLGEFDQVIKEQQQVIRDALRLARGCEEKPAMWVARIPALSEVRW